MTKPDGRKPRCAPQDVRMMNRKCKLIYKKGRKGTPTMRVLMFDIDTLRADHMGCYGYGRDTTPVMDQEIGRAHV